MNKVSLLLFLASSLLSSSLAAGISKLCSLSQLENDLLFDFRLLLGVLLPHGVDLPLTMLLILLLHSALLLLGLLSQVHRSQLLVFTEHALSFLPLSESISLIYLVVSSQFLLNGSNLWYAESIEAKLKVNQSEVVVEHVIAILSNHLVELVVAQIQTKQVLVVLQSWNEMSLNATWILSFLSQLVRL